MLKRFGSIRNLILLSTIAVTVVGLVMSYFLATVIEQRAQVQRSDQKMAFLASDIKAILKHSNSLQDLNSIAQANEDTFGIVIRNNSKPYFISAPKFPSGREISVTSNEGSYSITIYTVVGSLS